LSGPMTCILGTANAAQEMRLSVMGLYFAFAVKDSFGVKLHTTTTSNITSTTSDSNTSSCF
jgi:hypothetical protein